jgi:hypothetical protein
MNRLPVSLAFFVLASSSRAAETQHLDFVGDAKVFSVIAIADGTVEYKPPFLKISLENAVARRTERPNGEHHVYGYRVGVAHNNDGGVSDVMRWSDEIRVDREIAPKESLKLPTPPIAIPIDGLTQLRGCWLVMEFDLAGDKSRTTYAHSAKLQLP